MTWRNFEHSTDGYSFWIWQRNFLLAAASFSWISLTIEKVLPTLTFPIQITAHIEYDVSSFFGGSRAPSAAKEVLARRKAVCAGYCNLFYALAKAVQLETKCRKVYVSESSWTEYSLKGWWMGSCESISSSIEPRYCTCMECNLCWWRMGRRTFSIMQQKFSFQAQKKV